MMDCKTSDGGALEIVEPTVEMRDNPEGIALLAPRFSWQLATDKQDVMQTAYQIEVADSDKGLQTGFGLVWNSGRVESDQSVLVKYAGRLWSRDRNIIGVSRYGQIPVTRRKVVSNIGQWLCWTVRTGKLAGLD